MKITKATFKSFLRKNKDRLYIKNESGFDGMVDCVMSNDNAKFTKVEYITDEKNINQNNLGITGLWLVNHSRDYFDEYKTDNMFGYRFYNCCGSGILTVLTINL
jgi:hypothetical protein